MRASVSSTQASPPPAHSHRTRSAYRRRGGRMGCVLLRCMSPLMADSFEKVGVSTHRNFFSAVVRFSDADAGGLIIHLRLMERVLNRPAAVISVNRRCPSYFGRYATTLDLRLFQQNRPLASLRCAEQSCQAKTLPNELYKSLTWDRGKETLR
jgi:hypothetical protein